jgi:hypothetical protein
MLTVCCVQWGAKYSDAYVWNLYHQVAQWLSLPHQFLVLTDRPEHWRDKLVALPLQGGLPGWWNKLTLFNPEFYGLDGRILYLDLDVVVVDWLDPIAEFDSPFACHRDFMRPREAATAVMVFDADSDMVRRLWQEFSKDPKMYMGLFHGDQEFVDAHCRPDFLPQHWVVSYKLQALKQPPSGARVVCFHGQPKPHECSGWVSNYWHAEVCG